MKTIIQAAIESGYPPLALLENNLKRKPCSWDAKLIKAYYLEKVSDVEGYPIWVEESKDITFVAKTRTIRSQAAVAKKQDEMSQGKAKNFGVSVYAEAVLRAGKTWPTRDEWIAKRNSGPTETDLSDELQVQRVSDAESRAAAKVANNPDLARIVADMEAKLKSRTVD